MKMDAAERVSPQGSLSFFRLPHHFVVGFASLCHDSSHDLPLSAAPLHPARAARAGDPGTPPQHAQRVLGTPVLALGSMAYVSEHWNPCTGTIFGFIKEQPCTALSHVFSR